MTAGQPVWLLLLPVVAVVAVVWCAVQCEPWRGRRRARRAARERERRDLDVVLRAADREGRAW